MQPSLSFRSPLRLMLVLCLLYWLGLKRRAYHA